MRASHLLAVFLLAAAGCFGPSSGVGPDADPALAATAGEFRITLIDPARVGSEPSLAIAPDGSVFVCSSRGVGAGTDLWVSMDGGGSFQYLGTQAHGNLPILRSGGGDVGGGDCDLSVDEAGRVYLVDLWGGGVSVASTTDHGATWRGVPVSIPIAPLDRPWVEGGAKDEVFVAAAQFNALEERTPMPTGGLWVGRSSDGGMTFPQRALAAGNENRLGVYSNLARDAGNLYVSYTKKTGEGQLALMVAVSNDRGATWHQRVAAGQTFFPGQCIAPTNIFPTLATDGVGGVYAAWALQNPETERSDLFLASSQDSGETWTAPLQIADRPGTRAFPWLAARGPGSVGLAWYETNATTLRTAGGAVECAWDDSSSGAEWYLHYASVEGAFASPPTITDALVQPKPVHAGPLNRPYAELLQLRFTVDGRAAVAYVADVDEGAARPMFAIQQTSRS